MSVYRGQTTVFWGNKLPHFAMTEMGHRGVARRRAPSARYLRAHWDTAATGPRGNESPQGKIKS